MTNLLIYINRTEHRAWMYEEALASAFPGITIRIATNHEEALGNASWMDIMVTYGGQLNDELIAIAANLKWIHTLATGVDWVWRLEHLNKDVLVTSTRGIHGPPVSEMGLLLMMALGRGFLTFVDNQRTANWVRYPGELLHGKTVGILGIGAIAEELVPKCKVMGMTVIGISETERPVDGIDRFCYRRDLVGIAPELDHLVLLVPYTPETDSIINADVLAAMKPTAFLINLARGGVVNEDDLIKALQTNSIAGAGLDAFRTEPLPAGSPLWRMENVIVTPHNSGLYDEYPNQALPILEHNLRCFLAEVPGDMINRVDGNT